MINVSLLGIDEALSIALKAEKEAAGVYEKLRNMINNFVMRQKLDFLIQEEKKHQEIIENLFQKLFPNKKPMENVPDLAPRLILTLEEEAGVLDLLEQAMEAEKIFEEFYDELSEEVEERGVQEILSYLSNMEHGHYALLKGEYDLCSNDEQYYQRGDFQYDMVHIGP